MISKSADLTLTLFEIQGLIRNSSECLTDPLKLYMPSVQKCSHSKTQQFVLRQTTGCFQTFVASGR